MAIPRPIVDEVRARTDIAEVVGRTVTLRRSGRNFSGLCPFHNEKTPSFNVVPDKGIFHCFGCGEGGDVFAFLMKTRGVSFFEAVKELGDAAGVVVEERELSPEERQRLERRADLHDVAELSCRYFQDILLARPEGLPGREYLTKRGITLETAQKYRLGFAPDSWDGLASHLQRSRIPAALAIGARVVGKSDRSDRVYDLFRNRLQFPILDDRGRVVAFGGRLLPNGGDGPKYLNSPESEIYNKSRTLYGLSWARMAVQRKDRLILVEGYFDAVSLWQAGFEEAVATCGTALTPTHCDVVKRLTKNVVALFDSDEAGLKAAEKSMELFLNSGIEGRRLELGAAKDPDEFVQKNGAPGFEAALEKSVPLLEMVMQRIIEREGLTPSGRQRALDTLVALVRRLPANLRSQAEGRLGELVGTSGDYLSSGRVAEVYARIGHTEDERAPAAAPPPTRWVPSRELSHILWLLLHFPAKVAPVLGQADPSLLTDRRSVLEAIVALAGGASLAEVADGRDPELARVLRAIAARPAEYEEDTAEAAVRTQLAKLELARVDAEILTINAKIAACGVSGDKSSYGSLAREVVALQLRQQQLRKLVAGRGPR